ncbi:MAG: phage holin family protein [Patescibacteria group bacterium]
MKRILRMFIFSSIALYLTSLWNVGFIVSTDPHQFLRAVILIASAYYLIVPISKVIFLPLNILTFGLVSFAVFAFFLYVMNSHLEYVQITDWVFQGGSYFGIHLNNVIITEQGNLILSALFISAIIKLLEFTT